MMACNNKCRSVDKNLAEAVVSDCALFIVMSCALRLGVRRFFITLVGVLDSVELRVTTEYLLMGFTA